MIDLLGNLDYQIGLILKTGLALVLGGAIGFEREMSDKPAGLRTHMLVAAAATLLVGISDVLVLDLSADLSGVVQADPIRMVEAVVTGVAVLGAGTILRRGEKSSVEGLTTAASLFLTGGIGIAVALSQYVLAVAVTLFAWLTLRAVAQIERLRRPS